jgi:hypothetical protein
MDIGGKHLTVGVETTTQKEEEKIGVQSRTTKSLSIRERLLVMALDILFCFVLIGFGSCNQYNTKCMYHFLSRHLIYKLIN